MNIRKKVKTVPVPPVCSVHWRKDDWDRIARRVDPAPRRECMGYVWVFDPKATKREGKIVYRRAQRVSR